MTDTLAQDLRALTREMASTDAGLDDLLRQGLDGLARIAPYDLATVFELDGDRLVSRVARGPLASEQVAQHGVSLAAFPSIREALDARRARAFLEQDHAHGDGDPFDGVLDLPPGHACMVVPLAAGARTFGVMTLDRKECERYPAQVVDLVDVYGQLLALAWAHAEQRAELARFSARDSERLRALDDALHTEVEADFGDVRSFRMKELVFRARQVAVTETPVLLRGETGTGKERLARALHAWSRRADRPFVKVNCAALPPGLLESELFGHVKGSFTGAVKDRAGRFATADGGTLLLDEIGELPLELQAKLLRVLQEGSFEPVGSDRTVKVDVRLLAATHVDLEQAIAAGRFREDLYYRLAVFPLALPPLRERLDELAPLCVRLLAELASRTGRQGFRVNEAGLAALGAYGWPGNLRELANVLERATILARTLELGPKELDLPRTGRRPAEPKPSGESQSSARPPEPRTLLPLAEQERRHIQEALQRTGGRLYGPGGAAELLGLPPSTLQSRMKKWGIARKG